MEIRNGGLDDPRVLALLEHHVSGARARMPAGSVHVLDIERLRAPDMDFWTAWEGEVLLGMGALKALGEGHFEIKSMRTTDAARRRGVGAAMLAHLVAAARARGARRISLETGAPDYYAPARALYGKGGFVPCPPFADYVEDPNSVYMTLDLETAPAEAAHRKAGQ